MLFVPVIISFILNLEICNTVSNICKSDTNSNIILAIVHSSIVSLATLYYFYTDKLNYYEYLKIYSVGYLMADGCYFYIYRKLAHRYIYLIHHTLFTISWIWFDIVDLNLFNLLLLSELTTPFLNLKILCKKYNLPKLEFYSAITTYILFFIFRVLTFSYGILISYQRNIYKIYPIIIPLTSMQYYWFYLMTKKVKKIKWK